MSSQSRRTFCFGLVLIFLSFCTFSFLLFLRSPETPPPPEPLDLLPSPRPCLSPRSLPLPTRLPPRLPPTRLSPLPPCLTPFPSQFPSYTTLQDDLDKGSLEDRTSPLKLRTRTERRTREATLESDSLALLPDPGPLLPPSTSRGSTLHPSIFSEPTSLPPPPSCRTSRSCDLPKTS